jgi:arylsulfatase A-like enzyme
MKGLRLLALAALASTIACGGGAPASELGPLAELEAAPVRLAQETRPTVAAARNGEFSTEFEPVAGRLALAFGWQADSDRVTGARVRVSLRLEDGSDRVLANEPMPPRDRGLEGWQEVFVPMPEEAIGRRASLTVVLEGRPKGWSLFSAVPRAIPDSAGRPNIILVSADTLRADRLGCYGHDRPTSPAIDALAREGTRFENAVAQANWTLPSHYSMMTSLYPSAHGVNPTYELMAGTGTKAETLMLRASGREETLAERLSAMGYFSAAITEGGWVDPRFGFDQGFASYVAHQNDRLTDGTQRLTVDWLERHRELPFFLFVHTYQTHQPYQQPPPYDTMFVDEDHIGFALPGVEVPMEMLDTFRDGTFRPMPGDVEAIRGLYDGSVRYLDSFIKVLLDEIRRHGLERRTILLFTSDHGEELFENGEFDHISSMRREVLRVPFILWGPGRIPAGETHATPVASLDILPTLVELAGGAPEGTLQGASLVPLLAGETGGFARTLFSESDADKDERLVAAWEGNYKVILRDLEAASAELFDLARDPGETRDLAAIEPQRVARLRELILAWRAENERIHEWIGEATTEIDPEIEKRLRALGYL